jgi:hypothetical protein
MGLPCGASNILKNIKKTPFSQKILLADIFLF